MFENKKEIIDIILFGVDAFDYTIKFHSIFYLFIFIAMGIADIFLLFVIKLLNLDWDIIYIFIILCIFNFQLLFDGCMLILLNDKM